MITENLMRQLQIKPNRKKVVRNIDGCVKEYGKYSARNGLGVQGVLFLMEMLL